MCLKSSRPRSPSRVSIRWNGTGRGGDGGDKKDACDEMCVCKTVFPRQVVARYIASPRVNQSGWITIRANTSGVCFPRRENLPFPVCARISLIRDGIYYRPPPSENSILHADLDRKIYSNLNLSLSFFSKSKIFSNCTIRDRGNISKFLLHSSLTNNITRTSNVIF